MSNKVVHKRPPSDSWKLPCCGKFVFFVPDTDLVTKNDSEVTCGVENE